MRKTLRTVRTAFLKMLPLAKLDKERKVDSGGRCSQRNQDNASVIETNERKKKTWNQGPLIPERSRGEHKKPHKRRVVSC